MKTFCALILASVLLLSCEKDKFNTKPRLEFRSISPEFVGIGGDVVASFDFFDKEGDVDSIFIERTRINRRATAFNNPRIFKRPLPAFTAKSQGIIDVTLDYSNYLTLGNTSIPLPGNLVEPDTLQLRFFVLDKEGNSSDTIAANQNIVVIR